MPRDLRAYLWDIIEAAEHVASFTAGKTLVEYARDPLLKAGVERKFEIIGEALAQACRIFPEVTQKISNCEQIISFRNRLIHGYTTVSDSLVWDIIESDLPSLKKDAQALLHAIEGQQ
jgi:uncharacterized protein with HEPN domain